LNKIYQTLRQFSVKYCHGILAIKLEIARYHETVVRRWASVA